MNKIAIAVHGGAGTIRQADMTPARETLYREALHHATVLGYEVLKHGGSALDAVEVAAIHLENFPLFNAGKGAVFTHVGTHELDAAIACGKTRKAGAITGVQNIKNPIVLARAVMDRTQHVFLYGRGAEEFAREMQLPFESDEYFFTQERYEQWLLVKDLDTYVLDHNQHDTKFGTIGAVAVDSHGNVAAATSTGGMTNKKHGRIGDSPIIGAGTYADNATCAVSCTGHGEYFIRGVTAHDVACLMDYKGLSLQDACNFVIHEKMIKLGGEGGLIAVDRLGNIALPFNSEGMYRAWQQEDEPVHVAIYR